MYYRKKHNILYRDYGEFAYLTDNRNYGYSKAESADVGDRIISKTGAVFLSLLEYEPQSTEQLIEKIIRIFPKVSSEILKHDLDGLFQNLANTGFIVMNDSFLGCKNLEDINVMIHRNSTASDAINKVELAQTTQLFFEKYFNNMPQLLSIHVEIIEKCNERCLHCYIPHENKNKEMSESLFYNMLEQCKQMNILHITISGGEPMLHPRFVDFLRKCNEYNLSVNILTNLTLLTEEILDEMVKNKILSVQASLYSILPEIHDGITQNRGSCEKTKMAIDKLISAGIPVQISCPILNENLNYYKDVISWGNSRGISVLTDYIIIAQYDHNTSNLDCRLNEECIKNIIKENIKDDYDYRTQIQTDRTDKHRIDLHDSICSVCRASLCIAESGKVYPCVGWQDYALGDINKTPIGEIWNNSEKIKYLRNLTIKDFPKCINCSDREYCTMCMVRNANEDPNGNPLNVNKFFCNIAKLKKDAMLSYEMA